MKQHKNSLNIETIKKDSKDYKEIQAIKAQNNSKYSVKGLKHRFTFLNRKRR